MGATDQKQKPFYFLSFLGTGDYVDCHYVFEKGSASEFCSPPVKYTQEAVLRMLKHENKEVEKIVIFLTSDARSKNWEGEGKLKERLQNIGYDASKIQEVDVPNGFNRDQLLDIFEKFIAAVESDSRIIMDVTHAFRSLPLLSITSLNYLKSLKNVEIEGIYYGAFEALGSPKEVREMPLEERKAEMIDLLVLNTLQEWAAAVRTLVQYGNPDYLIALTEEEINPILAQTKGQDEVAADLRQVVNFIEKAFEAVRFVRLQNIYEMKGADKANEALERVLNKKGVLPPLRPVLEELKNLIGNLKPNSLDNAWVVLDWCSKYQWYAIGVNLLYEHVLSVILHAHGKNYSEKHLREHLSKAFHIKYKETEEEDSGTKLVKEMLAWEELNKKELLDWYAQQLSDLRNDVQHAGMRSNPRKSDNIPKEFNEFLKKAKDYLKK